MSWPNSEKFSFQTEKQTDRTQVQVLSCASQLKMPSAHNSAFCDPGRCLGTFLALTQHWPVLAPTVDCGLAFPQGTFRSLSARPGHNNSRLYHPVILNLQHFTIKMSRKRPDRCNATCVKFVNSQMWQGCGCDVADMILSAPWQIMSAMPSQAVSLIRYKKKKNAQIKYH